MFSIPNTTIIFQTYDADAGRTPQAQTFAANQLLTGGYVFCANAAVYIRLTVGATGQTKQLGEFFVAPGAQGFNIAANGNPIQKIEVRAATGTNAQFWGILSTVTDPTGSFYPASYGVDASGALINQVIVLTFQQDGVNKSARAIANFTSVGGIHWSIGDDGSAAALIPIPPIGVQHNDAGQLNEQIVDFEDGGGITWTLTDDPANHRVKVAGAVTTNRELGYTEITAGVNTTATTEATATTVVTAPTITFDGSTIAIVTFWAPRFAQSSAAAIECFGAYFDSVNGGAAASIGQVMDHNISETSVVKKGPIICKYHFTPSAATHQFSFRIWGSAAGGWTIGAGPAGAGNIMPAFIRVERGN